MDRKAFNEVFSKDEIDDLKRCIDDDSVRIVEKIQNKIYRAYCNDLEFRARLSAYGTVQENELKTIGAILEGIHSVSIEFLRIQVQEA